MRVSGWIWRSLLALIGAGAGAYIGSDVIGGATGATAAGAIVAAFAWPLFTSLFAWRRQRDEARRARGLE